jgi:hypothetical protein
VTAEEPSGQPGAAAFKVTLSAALTRAVTVNWATADGSATAGQDYTAGNGTLSFAAGETAKTVAITLLPDEQSESAETFLVNLGGAVGATVADAQAVGTIVEKGAAQGSVPSLSIGDVVARESEGATFTVTLSAAAPTPVSATFSTSDGSARQGLDYLARTATLNFAPGERTKTIAVTIVDDDLAEPSETFSVGLGNAVNATIARSRAIATIESSDAAVAGARQAPAPAGVLPVTVTPPADTGKTAKATKALVPRMSLWPLRVTVGTGGVARMTAACQRRSPVTCSGRVALETVAKPSLRLALTSFRVRPGRQATLSFKLAPRARALLAREDRIRARVVVLVKIGPLLWRVLPGVITLESRAAAAGSAPSRP